MGKLKENGANMCGYHVRNGWAEPGFIGQKYFVKEGRPPVSSESERSSRTGIPMKRAEKKTVLVIDDKGSFCTFVGLVLGKTGRYKVISATKPMRGILMARTSKPDLILLDVNMLHMDGARVAERLLEDARTKAIPILFVTGLVTNKETKHGQMIVAGRTFITKQATGDELLHAVSENVT